MSIMTGSQALVKTLLNEGVKYIFGNPGTSEVPIMNELESYPELKYILVMQEGVAMGMADAYARATGEPSFVNLHIETGLANGMSLLYNSFFGGTPIVVTAGNKDIMEIAHERTDLADLVRPFTKWSAEATHPDQVAGLIRRAFKEAKTPPTGPTFVGLSANALDGNTSVEIPEAQKHYTHIKADSKSIEDAAILLANANSPILVVADRVAESDASSEAVQLAETLGSRVYSSYYSQMNFPTDHPLYFGPIRFGFPDSKNILSKADVVLVIGKMSTSFYMYSNADIQFVGKTSKLIHLDADAGNVGKSQITSVGVIGDPKIALGQLLDQVQKIMSAETIHKSKNRKNTLLIEKTAKSNASKELLDKKWNSVPMSPERMMAEVAAALPDDFVLADDAVTTRAAYEHTLKFNNPGSLIGMRGGALGWGMGAGIGLKLAHPDRPVVAIVGDGSAIMTIQALWTAAAEKIPILYVICNNGSYKILKQAMNTYKKMIKSADKSDSKYIGMDFHQSSDIASVAKAMGVWARRIEDPNDIQIAVKEALSLDKPSLLDIIIDGSI